MHFQSAYQRIQDFQFWISLVVFYIQNRAGVDARSIGHLLDEDRKVNAQKFETAFYAKPDLRNVRPPEEPVKSEPATLDLESLVEQLQKSPELASALAALIAAQAPAK